MHTKITMWRQRRKEASENGKAAEDEYLASEAPFLHDLLTRTLLGGNPVLPATLLLFAEDGKLKVCLNDKQEGLVAFLTVDSAEDMFQAIEKALDEDKVDWRPKRRNTRAI